MGRWKGLKLKGRARYVQAAISYVGVCKTLLLPAWPVTPDTLEAYARRLGLTQRPSSVQSALGKIKTFCVACGLHYPSRGRLDGLRMVLRSLRRASHLATRRATPVRTRHLRLLDEYLLAEGTPAALRLRAMLWVGHGALLRSVELLSLCWTDIEFAKHGIRVRILPHNSKTSEGGAGEFIWIPRNGSGAYEALLAWKRECKGVLMSDLVWGFLSYNQWLRQMKDVGAFLGLDGVTTHSLRSGGCTDLLQGGASFELVRRQGRWRSDIFLTLYFRPNPEELTAHLGAALESAALGAHAITVNTGATYRQHAAKAKRVRKQHRVRWG